MTDITFDDKKVTVPFEQLERGDIFEFKDCIRMKIVPVQIDRAMPSKGGNSITLYGAVLLDMDDMDSVTYIADVRFVYEYGPFLEDSER